MNRRQNSSRREVLAAAAAAGLLLAGCGGSRDAGALSAEVRGRLQRVLDEQRARFNFPGAQAGVWAPNGSWVGVTGAAAPGGSAPPGRADHTRIGSITKTFTVIALLQLVEKSIVSLDDPIGKYVPNLPNGDTATLRMLASMVSGIPSYTRMAPFLDAFFSDPQRVLTPSQLVGYVAGQEPEFAPGTQVSYSNTNTVALGMVIEQLTGRPFAQVVKDGILDPLGMSQTLSPGASNALPEPHWRGITLQANPDGVVKDATDWNPSWGFSAGDMISTLDDLHRWAVALGTGEGIVTAETQKIREASMNSSVPPNSPERSYALGFGVFDGWVGHTGELPGFNTSVLYHPTSRTSVVTMVNSDIPGLVGGKSADPAPTIGSALIAALG